MTKPTAFASWSFNAASRAVLMACTSASEASVADAIGRSSIVMAICFGGVAAHEAWARRASVARAVRTWRMSGGRLDEAAKP